MVLKMWIFVLAVGFSVSKMTMAANVVALSADDLPKLLRSKNQNVSGAALLTEAAQARTGHLVRSYLPTLRAEAGGERFQTGTYSERTQAYGGAEVRINLFRGGRDLLEERARDSQVLVSEAGAKKAFESEITHARQLYWRLVFNKEMIRLLGKVVGNNERYLEMANRRIARGISTETDRLDFQIHRSQLKEDIESLTHENILLQISLAAVLGMESETEFKTEDNISHIHDEELLAAKFEPSTHPEVESLRANQGLFSSQRNQEYLWWTPSVDVYGGYYLYTLRERDYLSRGLRDDRVVGLKLTFNIFDGFQSTANAGAFAAQANAYEEQASQRARSVDAQVKVAKEDLKHDHELIHQSEERIEQGKKYLVRTLDEYNRGVKNSIDVLGAVQRQVAFQRQYAERRKNYQITKSGLLALLGQ